MLQTDSLCLYQQQGTQSSRKAKTKGKTMIDVYAELAEVEVDEAELTEEGVEVGTDLDAWMTEMLAGPSDYDY